MIRKGLGVGAAVALLVVGLLGFAHTPAGRPLLGVLGRGFRGKACPLGYDRAATPQAREQARRRFADAHRGQALAPSRPALGFVLDETSRGDVQAFMVAHGIACRPSTSIADLVCEQVPDASLSSDFAVNPLHKRDLWFSFGVGEKLIALTALSRDATAPRISAALAKATAVVTGLAGPPTKVVGEANPEALAGTLAQVSREFAFANYHATTRATNMGRDYLLTEEYRSLPNREAAANL